MDHSDDTFVSDDSDFKQSDFRVDLSAFRDAPPSESSGEMLSPIPVTSESGDIGSLDGESSPDEPQTFDQLFNSAYKDYLRNSPESSGDSDDSLVLERQIRHVVGRIKDGASDGSGLNRSEMMFMKLFQIQVQLGDEHEKLHHVAKEGWRSMLNAYIQRGSFEQVSLLMGTYDSLYGLHPSDRLLCLMKYYLRLGDLESARSLFQEAVDNGKTDDRGFSLMAKAFANAGDLETAHKLLDEAWMRALSDSTFKISNVFYGASSDILMRAGDLPRLRDLFTRLNANKPALDSRFYERRFKTINYLMKPSSDPTIKQNTLKKEDLVKMFEMVEQSMAKHTIEPTTQLRNEIIAFKLYTEGDVQQMFRTLSHYVTSPDVVTLNLILDALIHEGKLKMASTLCDSWDAQFGVKPDHSTSFIISKYLVQYCGVAIPETVTLLAEDNEVPEDPKLNATYSFQTPAFELFDELVIRFKRVVLTPVAMVAFCKFLVAVQAKLEGPRPTFSGLATFIAYLNTYKPSSIPSDDKTLYSMAQALFSNSYPDLALIVTALGRKRRIPSKSQAGLTSLELTWSHTFEPWADTMARWKSAMKEGAAESAFCTRAFTRVLLNRKPYPTVDYRDFLNDLLRGDIVVESSVLHNAWRLLYRATKGRSWDARAFWDLDRLRRHHRLPITSNMASQMCLILAIHSSTLMSQNEDAVLQETLTRYRNESPLARHSEPMPRDEALEFEALMDKLEPIFMSKQGPSRNGGGVWYEKSMASSE